MERRRPRPSKRGAATRREAAAEPSRTPIRLQHQDCWKHFHLGSHVGNVLTQSEIFVNDVAIFAGPTTAPPWQVRKGVPQPEPPRSLGF
jgi:hypothetical protein